MFLKIDHDAMMHQKVCDELRAPYVGYDSLYSSRCDCKKRGVVSKGTKICLLKFEKGIAFITTEDGQIGCVRASWFTIFAWRFNTVVIKEFKSWNGEDLAVLGVLIGFFFLIGMGIFSIVKVASANGEIDYCNVEAHHAGIETYYSVTGHRSWRSDSTLFYGKSYEEATTKMVDICPKK